jgi:hypothetical protein
MARVVVFQAPDGSWHVENVPGVYIDFITFTHAWHWAKRRKHKRPQDEVKIRASAVAALNGLLPAHLGRAAGPLRKG